MSRQRASVRKLVNAMVEQKEGAQLCQYPFFGLQDEVDEALEYQCHHILDVKSGPQFHKVLYAWRVEHGDYRGGKISIGTSIVRILIADE